MGTVEAGRGAEQLALVPPLDPEQVHVQTFEPFPKVTPFDPPAEHRLEAVVTGAEDVATPFAGPQAPLIEVLANGAEHIAGKPPGEATHSQLKGFEPQVAATVPAAQRFVVGMENAGTPLAEPQAPSTFTGAKHETVAPPLEPAHCHVQGPEPITLEAVPVEQRLLVGAICMVNPLAAPQTPLIAVEVALLAEHEAVDPPFELTHVQYQVEPSSKRDVLVPAVQRFVVGAEV